VVLEEVSGGVVSFGPTSSPAVGWRMIRAVVNRGPGGERSELVRLAAPKWH